MFSMSTLLGNILEISGIWASMIFVGAVDCEITFQFGQDESH